MQIGRLLSERYYDVLRQKDCFCLLVQESFMKLRFALFVSSLLASIGLGAQPLSTSVWNSGSLSSPVAIIQDPLNSDVQFVVQQGGAIRVLISGVVQPTNFMTLSVLTGSERGLLGLTFDPDHATNGFFYVYYTRTGPYMQLSRFTRVGNSLTADPATELRLFRTLRPFANHNSGSISFGPDGMLYFPTGDGGNGGDPGNRAQNPSELLGKFIRIDPRSDDFPADPEANYHIPEDNPFVDGLPITARTEIWSFGTRNPWKFSFDEPKWLGTGALVMADVGQDAVEEINYEPAGKGGRNYGWSRFEGNNIYNSNRQLAYEPHTPPIHTYNHALGQSITGGYVYRGLQLGAEYFGRYFFADYITGRVWSAGLALDPGTGEATVTDVVQHYNGELGNVSSFGVDSQGELFIVRYSGTIYRLNRPNSTWLTDVGRTEGLITAGQIRSLVLADDKLLEMQPFTAAFSPDKTTTLLVGAKTNVVTGGQINVSLVARVNQALSVPGELSVKNWATGQYDSVQSFTLGSVNSTVNATVSAANHIEPGTGRIEFKSRTSYFGPILIPTFKILYDQFTVSVS